MLAALVALVALSAYFSATETAFTSLNRIRLKTRADDGDKRAARTLALAADFDRLLSTLLIGNNIVNNVATTIGAVLFIQLIGPGKGPTVSATVLTIVILIFGEGMRIGAGDHRIGHAAALEVLQQNLCAGADVLVAPQ